MPRLIVSGGVDDLESILWKPLALLGSLWNALNLIQAQYDEPKYGFYFELVLFHFGFTWFLCCWIPQSIHSMLSQIDPGGSPESLWNTRATLGRYLPNPGLSSESKFGRS